MTTRRAVLLSTCTAWLSACLPRGSVTDTTTPTDSAPPDTAPPPPPCAQGAPGEGWIALPLADYPELDAVHGSAVVSISGRPVVVAQVDEDCYVALDQQCTHEGCAIEYRDNNRFVCPCHGALFSFTGEVLGGPAPRPVAVHATIRDGDAVWVRPEPGLD